VLFDLVSRGVGALFRFQPAHLADVARLEFDHRHRALHQFHDERKQIGAMASYPVVSNAVFRFEFCRARERKKFHPDLFARPKGDFRRADFLRNFLRVRLGIESFQTLSTALLRDGFSCEMEKFQNIAAKL
jgi:hypothetical protein